MEDRMTKLKYLLENNEVIKSKAANFNISGSSIWDIKLSVEWAELGNLIIEIASIYDLWAIKEWYLSLSFKSRYFYSIFPVDNRIEKFIARHLKGCEEKKDLIFNIYFEGNVIGHFFIYDIKTKPVLGIGISDEYQGNKLGLLAMNFLIEIMKIIGNREIYLTTMKENEKAFDFYKKIGFEYTKDVEVDVPGHKYKTKEYEMKLNIPV